MLASSAFYWNNDYLWQSNPHGFSTRKMGFANLSTGDLGWVDYSVEMDIKFEEFSQWGNLRVMVRQNGLFDCYCLNIDQSGLSLWRYDGRWDIGVKLGGYHEQIDTNKKYNLVLSVKDNKIEVIWNGTTVIKGRDNDERYPYGGVVLRTEMALTEVENININFLKTIDSRQATKEMWEKTQKLYPVPESPKPFKTAEEVGFNNMMLIYTGYYSNGAGEWSFIDALPYVGYLDSSLNIADTFFDAFLFLGIDSPKGRNFGAVIGGNKETATKLEDWVWYLDKLFEDQKQLAAFDKAQGRVNEILKNEENAKAKVVIMIPNPLTAQDDFGEIEGEKLSFGFTNQSVLEAQRQRFKAVDWYVKQIETRWQRADFKNLELTGFYWMSEDINKDYDKDIVLKSADYLHAKGYMFYWIPFNKAPGYDNDYNFDAVFLQPNYMFNQQVALSRFWHTYIDALTYGTNFEIEGESSVLKDPLARERYLNYLKAGVTLGYINSAKAYYFGSKVLATCAVDDQKELREIYDQTYLFAKGKFTEGLWD